jgi:aryl-alcohol dehydrogenase-like predicted oxidoreductase
MANSGTFPVDRLSQLSLGTAQLGMPYGITNPTVELDEGVAHEIMSTAWANGITCIDTAHDYGLAERRIGTWCADSSADPLLVSKFPRLTPGSEHEDEAALRRHFESSCAALGVTFLEAYLAHRPEDIERPGVVRALRGLRDEGRIASFGVSAYRTEQVDAALAVGGVGFIQVPISLFDRRILRDGILTHCRAEGVVVAARSAFLQGAVFMYPDRLPSHLQPLAPALARLRQLAAETGIAVAALAIGYLQSLKDIDTVVVGTYSVTQLQQVLQYASPLPADLLAEVADLDLGLAETVINPSLWPAR